MTTEPPEDRGPWGIIITGTLHLTAPGPGPADPACGDQRVERAMAECRQEWTDNGPGVPLYGYADGRRVCLRCIARLRTWDDHLCEQIEKAVNWNLSRSVHVTPDPT